LYPSVGDIYLRKLELGIKMSVEERNKNIAEKDLFKQYNWFVSNFLPRVEQSSTEFFSDIFSFYLASVSKNINVLFQGNNYFVTKVRIDKQNNVFIRCSEDAIQIILDSVLGRSKKSFKLETVSELEAKIITSFNDYLYEHISEFIIPTPLPTKNKALDIIHLTFFIRTKENPDFNCGKIIISIPEILLNPENIVITGEKFQYSDFYTSTIPVNLKLGTTKFTVKDLKQLEKDDLVIFENSNANFMTLKYKDYQKQFQIRPNPGLIISIEDNNNSGGNNMADNASLQNLWDNIEVEMGAEFDKVKITLGELKNIEQGLVVDLNSIYNNKISLKVEDKVIARGELVIINDRYGVRIEKVFASDAMTATQNVVETSSEDAVTVDAPQEEQPEGAPPSGQEGGEDLDYSDFELEDEDI
jgi:flagellar motor switch/type III secretory pathway protein FliN